MIMQLIVQAGYGREEGSVLYPIYCDEFQHYVNSDIPEVLQNLRKYGIGMVLSIPRQRRGYTFRSHR
jgi:hypothetical protein